MKPGISTSVAIFAGGKSSRFGTAKSRAKLGGKEFVELIVASLQSAGLSEIVLVGGEPNDADRWGVRFLHDEFVDAGPLGALITAMRFCETKHLMVLPCDVPKIDAASCQILSVLPADKDVLVARTKTPQWLCSTWRTSRFEVLEEAFDGGERAIHKVVQELRTDFVDMAIDAFENFNEPHQVKSQS